jgi:hypothetical protein
MGNQTAGNDTAPINRTFSLLSLPANGTARMPPVHATCDPPLLFVSEEFLFGAWRTLYWIMFCLTWFMLPIIQGYCDSGYFTPWERLKKALRANFIYYLSLGSVGVCVLVWIAVKYGLGDRCGFGVNFGGSYTSAAMLGFVMALANLWGLSLVVVFLAFGLIEVPRSIWHTSDRRRSLKYHAFRVRSFRCCLILWKAPKVKDGLNDADLALSDLTREIMAISHRVRFHDDMRPYVDKVLENVCDLI